MQCIKRNRSKLTDNKAVPIEGIVAHSIGWNPESIAPTIRMTYCILFIGLRLLVAEFSSNKHIIKIPLTEIVFMTVGIKIINSFIVIPLDYFLEKGSLEEIFLMTYSK